MLNKLTAAAQELTDRLALSEDIVFASAKLTVIAGSKILVENHRGIMEYGAERIVIGLNRGKICLSGTGFTIDAMNKNELLISGKLQCVDWE